MAASGSSRPVIEFRGGVAGKRTAQRRAVEETDRATYQAMEALGMKAALTPKIVEGDNIGKTYQFVATGNAQAGFVAMSQCAKDGKFTSGSGWVVPQELYKPITQDAVLLKAGEKNEGAKRFLEYLKTNKEADRIRFVYGYDTAK